MVKIRLARAGRKRTPFYRVVVAESSAPRDGKFIEIVGTYNPITTPSTITLNTDRINYWKSVGAQPTERVKKLITAVESSETESN